MTRRISRDEIRQTSSATRKRSFVVFLELSPSCKSCNSSPFCSSTSLLRSCYSSPPTCHASPLPELFQPSILDALVTITTDESTCKFGFQFYPLLHSRETTQPRFTASPKLLSFAPSTGTHEPPDCVTPPYPISLLARTFQSSRRLCFLWFGVAHCFLLLIYTSWSLEVIRRPLPPRFKLTLSHSSPKT